MFPTNDVDFICTKRHDHIFFVKTGMFLHHFFSFSTKYGIYQNQKSYNTLYIVVRYRNKMYSLFEPNNGMWLQRKLWQTLTFYFMLITLFENVG